METWRVLLRERTIPNLLGGSWTLGLFVAGLAFCRGKALLAVFFMIGLFFTPFLLFTNLHFVHDYYQYANGFWLLLAFALTFSQWSQAVPNWFGKSVLLAVVATQLLAFHRVYYAHMKTKESPAMALGELIRKEVDPDEALIVLGDDWSPEEAFFSQRRCVYLPAWLDKKTTKQALDALAKDPTRLLSGHRVGAVVINESSIQRNYVAGDLLRNYLPLPPAAFGTAIGPYRVYFSGFSLGGTR